MNKGSTAILENVNGWNKYSYYCFNTGHHRRTDTYH